jgi:hypothetical protein
MCGSIDFNPKTRVVLWLTFGLMMMLLSITRPVGYAMIIAVVFYLLVSRQYISLAFFPFLSGILYSVFPLQMDCLGIIPGAGGSQARNPL